MAGAATKINRQTVNLDGFPDLVVIYLGMQVHTPKGMVTFARLGREIRKSVKAGPDGLLLHENILFAGKAFHAGMRQYWRDFEAMERWTRTFPHQGWWRDFLKDTGGTGFWHETYTRAGGIEAVYDDMKPVGMMCFAPLVPARGPMFSSRQRLGTGGDGPPPVVPETAA
jgi:hypothetical protein